MFVSVCVVELDPGPILLVTADVLRSVVRPSCPAHVPMCVCVCVCVCVRTQPVNWSYQS